jgi:solute:Na+ symporter, SSS family
VLCAGARYGLTIVTLLALFADRAGDLAIAYTRVSSYISGPMLDIFLLGITTRRATATGCLIGAAAGGLAVATLMYYTRLSFFYFGAIGTLITIGIGYLSSLPMAAPKKEQIVGFVMGEGPAGASEIA